MTKAEKAQATKKAVEMASWTKTQWAAFNRQYAAAETVTALHAVDKEAYKTYMMNAALAMTEEAGGHYGVLNTKRGAAYIDYVSMAADFAAMAGVSIEDLEAKYAKRRADTQAFSFK